LHGFPAERLDCPGQEDPHAHVAAVCDALLPLLCRAPDLLVVQGDTSSALGAALAAFGAGVPVAHVEAGLRTHDPSLPWPEEEYRTAIDAGAELLFAPTEISAANLRAEAVPGTIHVTGNTGIDALLEVDQHIPADIRPHGRKTILVTCHRRESWSEGLASIAAALVELADRDDVRIELILHPNPHVAARMTELLAENLRIALLPPCSHAELIGRMKGCYAVLSDSGGIQEEAPALGVPVLVLRDKTERPEGLASGNARLVGTSAQAIVAACRMLLDNPSERAVMARRSFPYGDGRAGPRIAAAIDRFLTVNASRLMSRNGAKNAG
jgi:UDP-N-acetylglucosamine 2-epimerase (non-hydrolysing)